MIYGNLRLETVLIKFDQSSKDKVINRIGFIGFGSLASIEDSEHIILPDKVEHLPPDMTKYLQIQNRFTS